MQGDDVAALIDGARQRMRQAGMNEEQIGLVERTGKTQARTTISAPIGGVVVELSVREGMTVMAGRPCSSINGLSTVWANAEVPESQAAVGATRRDGASPKPCGCRACHSKAGCRRCCRRSTPQRARSRPAWN
jgi:multidrug efflux pump subunit AcrA (membrane-fusion protein)